MTYTHVGADMTADTCAAVIALQDHRHRIPANDVFQPLFDFHITGIEWLLIQRNRVAIRGVQGRVIDDDIRISQIVA